MPFDARTVECWIFDLDNTLYPARSNLFDQVRERITDYVERHVGLARPAARDLQRDLFQRYGTTMNGLMAEHGLDPHDFLAYVHDIDYSPIDPDPSLDALLADLPGRKMIYTNGSVAHARNACDRLGVSHHFEVYFDIAAADFRPKPDPAPFRDFLAAEAIDPARAVFVEDMAINLEPAAALGLTTVWLRTEADWATAGADAAHVHHRAEDLVSFLDDLKRYTDAA